MSIPKDLLAAEGLKVELGGVPVLDIPSFSIREKEVVTIVGPNGSGKSTLLLTLACLVKPVAGRIFHRGAPLASRDAAFQFRRRISMVFQEPLLFDTTVYNNVASGLRIRGLAKDAVQERVMKYLKYFHCDHLARRSARKLSGGESQRISLARAFAMEPEIIFLDEAFSALDPPTRHSLHQDLDSIVRETGTTTIMVTHLESEALHMSGRIIVMNGGRIVQTGSPSAVMNNPCDEFVARFVGMENVLKGKALSCHDDHSLISVYGREIRTAGKVQPGEDVCCCIRPKNVVVNAPNSGAANGHSNSFPGRITQVYSMGSFLKLTLDCGFALVSYVSREAFDDLDFMEGKEVHASFSPESVHIVKTART